MGKSERHKSVIKLPFGINRKSNRRCLFLDNSGKALPDQGKVMQNVQRVELDTVLRLLGKGKKSSENIVSPSAAGESLTAGKKEVVSGKIASLLKGCKMLHFLTDKARDTNYLTHFERIILLYTLGFAGKEGGQYLHKIMGYCYNYNRTVTENQLTSRKEYPISCAKIMDYFPDLAQSLPCDCSFNPPMGGYPSPVLFMLESEMGAIGEQGMFADTEMPVAVQDKQEKKRVKKTEKQVPKRAKVLDFESIFAEEVAGTPVEESVNQEEEQQEVETAKEEEAIVDAPVPELKPEPKPEPKPLSESIKEPLSVDESKSGSDQVPLLDLVTEYLQLIARRCVVEEQLEQTLAAIDSAFSKGNSDTIDIGFCRVRRRQDGKPGLIVEMD